MLVVGRALAQFGNSRDIDQHRNMHVAGTAFACPGEQVGRARDHPIPPAIRFEQEEGFL